MYHISNCCSVVELSNLIDFTGSRAEVDLVEDCRDPSVIRVDNVFDEAITPTWATNQVTATPGLKCRFFAEVDDSMAWKSKVQSGQSLANLKSDEDVRATEHAEYRGVHHFFRHAFAVVLDITVRQRTRRVVSFGNR